MAETLRAELAAAHERLGDAERLAGTVAELEGELSFLRKVRRPPVVRRPITPEDELAPRASWHGIIAGCITGTSHVCAD